MRILIGLYMIFFSLQLLAQDKNAGIIGKKTLGVYLYFEGGKRIRTKQLKRKMEHMPEAYKLMTEARKVKIAGDIIGFTSGAFIGHAISQKLYYNESRPLALAMGVCLSIAQIPFTKEYNAKSKKAVGIYNASIK